MAFSRGGGEADRRYGTNLYNVWNYRRGAQTVKSYRIYLVGADGRLQLGAAFEAADDDAAAARAVELAQPGQAAELWAGGRMVGRVSRQGVLSAGEG